MTLRVRNPVMKEIPVFFGLVSGVAWGLERGDAGTRVSELAAVLRGLRIELLNDELEPVNVSEE